MAPGLAAHSVLALCIYTYEGWDSVAAVGPTPGRSSGHASDPAPCAAARGRRRGGSVLGRPQASDVDSGPQLRSRFSLSEHPALSAPQLRGSALRRPPASAGACRPATARIPSQPSRSGRRRAAVGSTPVTVASGSSLAARSGAAAAARRGGGSPVAARRASESDSHVARLSHGAFLSRCCHVT
jgi:hypothetical protein